MSKTISATRQDQEAPIFELVDFGVVGDLFTARRATEAIKVAKAGRHRHTAVSFVPSVGWLDPGRQTCTTP